MAHRSVVYGLVVGMVGFALASGCVVKSDDDDGGEGGEGAESASGGESTGGSSTGGRGGSSTGGSATGGSATGGSATGGSATGGSATGGSATGGSATGGSGGMDTDPECDPDMDELVNTPYPDCMATAGNPCEACIEANCCAESRVCYGYDPGNVCGWGGPDGDGEITCYIACAQDYVDANGVFDDDGIDECTTECTTAMCGQIGNATQDLAICLQENCEEACWPAE